MSAQPRTVFGQIEGGLGGEFANVIDVVRGMDGTIVVADRQLSSITFFSPEGTLVATRGRQGEGPGEFSRMSNLVAEPEGRRLVFDEWQQRMTEFTLDGELIGDTRLTRGPGDRQIGGVGRLDDGSWYAWEWTHVIFSEVGGLAQDTVGFYKLADGEVGKPLARVRGPVSTAFKVFGSDGIRYALYSPRVLRASRGTCLMVGTSDEGGKRANFLQRMMIRSVGRKVQMASWVPFANDMVVDQLGYIWVQRYQPPEGRGSPEWHVFTETGVAVGKVTLPARLRVMEITADDILGFHTDELGQQDVRILSLDRGRDTEIRPLHPGCA